MSGMHTPLEVGSLARSLVRLECGSPAAALFWSLQNTDWVILPRAGIIAAS